MELNQYNRRMKWDSVQTRKWENEQMHGDKKKLVS